MGSVTAAVLIESKDAENAQTTQYTSTGLVTIIDKFTATNHTAAPAALSVNLVPSGGAAAAANLVTKTKTLQPGETYSFPELVGQILAAGDFVSTLADTATAIGIRASGRQVTT